MKLIILTLFTFILHCKCNLVTPPPNCFKKDSNKIIFGSAKSVILNVTEIECLTRCYHNEYGCTGANYFIEYSECILVDLPTDTLDTWIIPTDKHDGETVVMVRLADCVYIGDLEPITDPRTWHSKPEPICFSVLKQWFRSEQPNDTIKTDDLSSCMKACASSNCGAGLYVAGSRNCSTFKYSSSEFQMQPKLAEANPNEAYFELCQPKRLKRVRVESKIARSSTKRCFLQYGYQIITPSGISKAIPFIVNASLCLDACYAERSFECRSFGFSGSDKTCLIMNSVGDREKSNPNRRKDTATGMLYFELC